MVNPKIHLCFGDGRGKSTSLFGLALRALGRNLKVNVICFLKTQNTGEIKLLKEISENNKNLRIYDLFKDRGFYHTLCDNEVKELKREIESSILFIGDIIREGSCDLLILDEIIDVINLNLLTVDDLLDLLNKSKSVEIAMSGRNPDRRIIECSDYVTEFKKLKHPYDKGETARKGIEL